MAPDRARVDCRSRTDALLLSLNGLRASGSLRRWCAGAQENWTASKYHKGGAPLTQSVWDYSLRLPGAKTMMPKCPECISQGEVRRSHRHPLDKILSLIFLYPFRCDRCDCRFFRFQKPSYQHAMPR
jgi:hypothetical protein